VPGVLFYVLNFMFWIGIDFQNLKCLLSWLDGKFQAVTCLKDFVDQKIKGAIVFCNI